MPAVSSVLYIAASVTLPGFSDSPASLRFRGIQRVDCLANLMSRILGSTGSMTVVPRRAPLQQNENDGHGFAVARAMSRARPATLARRSSRYVT